MRRGLCWLVLLGACADPEPKETVEDSDSDTPIQVPDPEPPWLVRTSEIPVGDPECEFGGVRIETGVDDGSRDGVPGDGVLQDGEVRASDVVCNGAGDPPESPMPGGAEGDDLIRLEGGDGGGDGGELSIVTRGGLASEISLWTTGAVDASWDLPAAVWGLGTTPVVVSTDTVLRIIADNQVAVLEPDTLFLTEDGELNWWDGTRAFRPSALHVLPDVTLSAPAGQGTFRFAFTHDLVVEGSIVAPQRTLDLRCRNFFMGSGSRVDVSSDMDDAGEIKVLANVQTLGLSTGLVHIDGGTLAASGGLSGDAGLVEFIVAGALWWRGAAILDGGEEGGDGGDLAVETGGPAHLDGLWSHNGGGGGSAGNWSIVSSHGRFMGQVDLVGGDCEGCRGGRGGDLTAVAETLRLELDVRASGGAGGVIGGGGGSVDLAAYGVDASIDVGGTVDLGGGDHTEGTDGGDAGSLSLAAEDETGGASAVRWYGLRAATCRGGADGGEGGDVEIRQDAALVAGIQLSVGLTRITTPFDLRGGAGEWGGDGGDLRVTGESDGGGGRARIEVLGAMDVRGGDGEEAGGNGGSVWLSGDAGVTREGDILARAGDASGSSSRGGDGSVQTDASASVELWSRRGPVRSIGRIDVRGGHALVDGDGGRGGGAVLYGTLVVHEGDIDARGGDGNGSDRRGAAGGVVSLFSIDGGTQNAAGQIAVSGGSGAFEGARGTVLEDGFDTTSAWALGN